MQVDGAVFKLVPTVSPTNTGAVTGIISAIGGIGGFFPPLVMGIFKSATGQYYSGFILLACFALGCLVVTILTLKQSNKFFKSRNIHVGNPRQIL